MKEQETDLLELEASRAKVNLQEAVRLQHILQWVMVALKEATCSRNSIIEEIETALKSQDQEKE